MQIEQEEGIDNLPWIEKYRPATLNELISHDHILTTLRKFMEEGTLPNLLFYGPPGTGKTSTIVALARQIYKEQYSKLVLQLNASDERGIEEVRQRIKVFAGSMALTATINKSLKLVILDEVDMMTSAAQFALRRIIEKSWKNARFCLISNYVSKVIPALQSRCTRFKFKQIPYDDVRPRIQQICKKQHLSIQQSAIEAVHNLCQGDMRRVVNMLQSLSISNSSERKHLTDRDVYEFTGNPPPERMRQILKMLQEKNPVQCAEQISRIQASEGICLESIIKSIYQEMLKIIQPNKSLILQRLGEIEYRMSKGCDERIQLASLAGIFYEVRNVARQS